MLSPSFAEKLSDADPLFSFPEDLLDLVLGPAVAWACWVFSSLFDWPCSFFFDVSFFFGFEFEVWLEEAEPFVGSSFPLGLGFDFTAPPDDPLFDFLSADFDLGITPMLKGKHYINDDKKFYLSANPVLRTSC